MRGKHQERSTIGQIVGRLFALLGLLVVALVVFCALMVGMIWTALKFVH